MRKVLISIVSLFAIFLLVACGTANNNSSEDSDENLTENSEGNSEENAEENTNSNDGLLAELQEEGKIVVGFANERPYGYINDDGELTGASVDTARAVFAELGIDEVEEHLADFAQLVPGLDAGRYDAITAGMAITPDRCENAIFADPDMVYGEGLIVQKGNPLNLRSYEDIANNPDATISIMSGATEIGFVASEGVADDQVQLAPDIPATIAAVESGRADATTGTEMTLIMAMESANSDNIEFVEDFEQPDIDGVPSYGAVAFHPDNTDLRDAFNEKLAELKADGTVQEILEANGFDAERNFPEDHITAEMVCNGEE